MSDNSDKSDESERSDELCLGQGDPSQYTRPIAECRGNDKCVDSFQNRW